MLLSTFSNNPVEHEECLAVGLLTTTDVALTNASNILIYASSLSLDVTAANNTI